MAKFHSKRSNSAAIDRGESSVTQRQAMRDGQGAVEWPTLIVLALCTGLLLLIAIVGDVIPLCIGIPALALAMTLHSSLQHEALHGHPTRNSALNEALVFVPFGLFIPFRRFRDTHLQHHRDERLTDPHEDPESNYMDPEVWHRLSPRVQSLLRWNNTLAGRILVGPSIGMFYFYSNDLRLIRAGDRAVTYAYLLHALALIPFLWWLVLYSGVPVWAYVLSAYLALSILRVRTFLEHRADWKVCNRIVVVEDRGLFGWLFLNNNYHLVHHLNPGICWYRLPAYFRAHREELLGLNEHYYFPNYRCIFARYFFKAKDPVPHPFSASDNWNPGNDNNKS